MQYDWQRTRKLQNRMVQSRLMLTALVGLQTLQSAALALFFRGAIDEIEFGMLVYQALFWILLVGMLVLPEPPARYGLDFDRMGSDLKRAWPWAATAFVLALGLRLLLAYGADVRALQFIPGFNVASSMHALLYPIAAFLQEAVLRVFFQSYLIGLLGKDRRAKGAALAICSLVFAQFYIIFGFTAFALAFVLSLIPGLYFERTRMAFGTALVHTAIAAGMLGFSVL